MEEVASRQMTYLTYANRTVEGLTGPYCSSILVERQSFHFGAFIWWLKSSRACQHVLHLLEIWTYIYTHLCHCRFICCVRAVDGGPCVPVMSVLSSRICGSLSVCLQHGMTPLHVAVYRGCPEIVDLLLAAGANPDITAKVCLPYSWHSLCDSNPLSEVSKKNAATDYGQSTSEEIGWKPNIRFPCQGKCTGRHNNG